MMLFKSVLQRQLRAFGLAQKKKKKKLEMSVLSNGSLFILSSIIFVENGVHIDLKCTLIDKPKNERFYLTQSCHSVLTM